MKIRFLLSGIFLLCFLFGAQAQNLQSIIKNVRFAVENNVHKVYVTADWGDNASERITLEYVSGTNNTYGLNIKNALINQSSLSFGAVVSKNNGFIFSTEQSDLLTELSLLDTVSEENGKIVYLVTLKMIANKPVTAVISGFDKTVLEIILTERYIPGESLNTSSNSISNTTSNIASSGKELTFNPDGTPFIVPDEIGSVPRKGLTDESQNRQPVPVISKIDAKKSDDAPPAVKKETPLVPEPLPKNNALTPGNVIKDKNSVSYHIVCCDKDGGNFIKKIDPILPNRNAYIDESISGKGRPLYENPALMNVMIVSSKKRKKDALKLSVILNKEKRTTIQNRLGMSFRVVNVATVHGKLPKKTTVFYRKKYLKPAIVLSDEVDGNQKILKMLNPETKIGVDVEIVLGDR